MDRWYLARIKRKMIVRLLTDVYQLLQSAHSVCSCCCIIGPFITLIPQKVAWSIAGVRWIACTSSFSQLMHMRDRLGLFVWSLLAGGCPHGLCLYQAMMMLAVSRSRSIARVCVIFLRGHKLARIIGRLRLLHGLHCNPRNVCEVI